MGILPMGNLGSFFTRKASCNSRATQALLSTSLAYAVFLCAAVRPTEATLLQQVDTGSLTCTEIWVHAIHTKWGWVRHKRVHKS